MATAAASRADSSLGGTTYLHWGPIIAGALVAAAVSFVLITFGAGIGLSVASPSATWRDTSAADPSVRGVGACGRYRQFCPWRVHRRANAIWLTWR